MSIGDIVLSRNGSHRSPSKDPGLSELVPSRKRRRATTRPTGFVYRAADVAIDEPLAPSPAIDVRFGSEAQGVEDVVTWLSSELGASHRIVRFVIEHRANASVALLDALPLPAPEPASPSSEQAIIMRALSRLRDPVAVPALLVLLSRHAATLDTWCHAVVYALSHFGESVVEPALVFVETCPEVRHLIVEVFSLARVTDERAFTLAFEVLDEDPTEVAEMLAEWRDPRALAPLRARLARIPLDSGTADSEAAWELTEAILALGGSLTSAERAARRAAFASHVQPRLSVDDRMLEPYQNAILIAPTKVASLLSDLGGPDVVALLRGRLALLDGRWPDWSAVVSLPNMVCHDHDGSARAALALIEALVVVGATLEDREVAIRTHASAAIDASGEMARFGERPRSDAELYEERCIEEKQRAEEEEQAKRPSLVRDFDAALLSLDEAVIRAVIRKWPILEPLPDDPGEFWTAIHRLRTMLTDLPFGARKLSREWLIAHGVEPHPDPAFDAGPLSKRAPD